MGTMRERNVEISPRREGRRHARNNLVVHPRGAKLFRFFATPTEDERIAPFESDNSPPCSPFPNQELVNVRIFVGVIAGQIPHANFPSGRRREIEQAFRCENVVQHHLGLSQEFDRPQGQQPWIARPRPDECDWNRVTIRRLTKRIHKLARPK
jgi:hypothetical protein